MKHVFAYVVISILFAIPTMSAAQWQDPLATSWIGLSIADMAADGIPPGFDVIVGALYEADTAQVYDDILSGN